MTEETNLSPENTNEEKHLLNLDEAKASLNTLEGLLRMRQKKQPKNQSADGTKSNDEFDIDPIPGYGGTW